LCALSLFEVLVLASEDFGVHFNVLSVQGPERVHCIGPATQENINGNHVVGVVVVRQLWVKEEEARSKDMKRETKTACGQPPDLRRGFVRRALYFLDYSGSGESGVVYRVSVSARGRVSVVD
jgi:hypothetical protein